MQLYSTRDKSHTVGLKEAVLRGLPPDNGLYMPESIPSLPADFLQTLPRFSFPEISLRVAETLLGDSIPQQDLHGIIERAINFPAPVVKLDEQKYILELFHGPSLAFKDFGARFMAELMSYFNRGEDRELIILVATSGDTGGAVAAGFHRTPGIQVVILYPSGKVSDLQEKQLTTLGHNVTALEVDGAFDDCQALVKKAFLDEALNQKLRLSSANSINIARLIPQSFYYFEAYKQLPADGRPVVFCVPSGNFGNLTAGLIAHRMGLPVDRFLAATNVNDVVPAYLLSGDFRPRPSVRTLSNAMDVGNPSNFARMLDLYTNDTDKCSTWNNMRKRISGYHYTDDETREAMREVADHYHYTIDPHGAIGYRALADFQRTTPGCKGVVLETAHPAKFKPDVEATLGHAVEVPERLARLANLPKEALRTPNDYPHFREWLQSKFL